MFTKIANMFIANLFALYTSSLIKKNTLLQRVNEVTFVDSKFYNCKLCQKFSLLDTRTGFLC